jgi:hypothetical protein
MLCRAARAGFVVEEVSSFERRRREGTSKLNAFRDGLRVANALFRERVAPPGSFQGELQQQERMARRLGAAVPRTHRLARPQPRRLPKPLPQ